jgi:UDP-N-acetylmuramoyl-L-alanyl-D-glutamate--2,6-diaminopimelate ligase
MKLESVLSGIMPDRLNGAVDKDIKGICINSKQCKKDYLFIAIKGYDKDGHKYIREAVNNGACAILCEDSNELIDDITYIFSKNTRKDLSKIASNFYHTEDNLKKLFIVCITGTNGKSSTASIVSYLLNSKSKCSMSASTGMYMGNQKINDNFNTTPDALQIHKFIKKSTEENCSAAILEASAQALTLHRIDNLHFKYGIFTNLSPEHLDFYDNMEKYYFAKASILEKCDTCIINADDIYGRRLIKQLKAKNKNIITYAIYNHADYEININYEDSSSIEYDIVYFKNKYDFKINIPSEAWVYNSSVAAILAHQEGYDIGQMAKIVQHAILPNGRMQKIKNDCELNIIIDYAHTIKAYHTVLQNVKRNSIGRVISVFGCGGERDKTNRPNIGKCVSELSDICIITDDNPRKENSLSIISDIISGIDNKNYAIIQNRKEAIKFALDIADENDTIIILGKGHEKYQIINDEYIPFDEKSIINEILSARGRNGINDTKKPDESS